MHQSYGHLGQAHPFPYFKAHAGAKRQFLDPQEAEEADHDRLCLPREQQLRLLPKYALLCQYDEGQE